MKFVNVGQLKAKTSEILRIVEKEDVVITRYGKPHAVLHRITEDELEDFVIVNHPEFKARRKQAKQAYQEGKTTDIDNLIQEIRDGRL
ncbi:type II toxin-antitoxin system prevent-host-death family antitoxin [Candidatus Poribacteria bacterium]|nr:type II toxin-antitoxin system prevent-host-death family antitoxin [Candidatus Poribacteria bacterium]